MARLYTIIVTLVIFVAYFENAKGGKYNPYSKGYAGPKSAEKAKKGAYGKFESSDESKSNGYGNSKRSKEENRGHYGKLKSSDETKSNVYGNSKRSKHQEDTSYKKVLKKYCRRDLDTAGRFTDLKAAKAACDDKNKGRYRNECSGFISHRCDDKKFYLCASSELRRTTKGHCVYKKKPERKDDSDSSDSEDWSFR